MPSNFALQALSSHEQFPLTFFFSVFFTVSEKGNAHAGLGSHPSLLEGECTGAVEKYHF